MANQSHNMLWKEIKLVKQEEDPFPIYSSHIYDEISNKTFSIFENWDLDLLLQQPVFVNDPNTDLLLDDPYPLEMLAESSLNPEYSLLPGFDMELEPINSFLGFEDYIYQMDHIHNSSNMGMNNNEVMMCEQNQIMSSSSLMSGVCNQETLGIPEESLWLDKVEDNKMVDHGGMVIRAGAKRSRWWSSVEEDIDEGDNNYSKAITLSREAISEYFYMPITEAAKEMNIGVTLLKKRCREVGIRRWPHRKLMSLKTLINNVEEMGDGEEKKKKVVVEMLENEMRLMEQLPDRELGQNTKKLRQACFKANYKKRKLLFSPHLLS